LPSTTSFGADPVVLSVDQVAQSMNVEEESVESFPEKRHHAVALVTLPRGVNVG
jgi:hypothetical protein